MRNVTILLAVAAMLALAVPAGGDYDWDNGSGDDQWTTTENWDPDGTPTWGDSTYLDDAGEYCEINGDAITQSLYVGHNVGGCEVQFVGGTFEVRRYLIVGYKNGASQCEFTQSNGALTFSESDLVVGISVGMGTTANGLYTISGGSITRHAVKGGALLVGDFSGGVAGVGTFKVDGGNPSGITVEYYTQLAGSTLEMAFDGDGDPIQQIDVDGTATLSGTLDITGTADAGTYTIMTYGSRSNWFTTVNTPNDDDWTVNYDVDIDPVTPGVQLGATVTYVPEPMTLALLGIGGLGVLLRRKRR